MAAEKGNKYAEKWTVEKARKLAHTAYESVDDNTYFISAIAEKCETYRDLFSYLLDKFNDDDDVFRTLKRMYNKCESIIWEKAAKTQLDKTIAIFALKSLHGLFESSHQHVDHTTKDEAINQITVFQLPDNGRD